MGDRYYYDYHGGSGRRTSSKKWHFVFPFVLLIIIGVVLILGFQVFRFFFPGDEKDAVYMYTANGNASIKIWGTDTFAKAYSGTQILQGDEVRTAKDSKVVVKVFDGTLIRLSGDTYVTFNEIFSDGGQNDVQVILHQGEVWVNKTQATSSGTNFILTAGNLNVSPKGTVFDVSSLGGVNSVRVLYGAVVVDVNSQDGGTAVDHIEVDEGSEAVFDDEKMAKFWAFQAPNVVVPISDLFKLTPWYVWNVGEDEAPTDFAISPEAEDAAKEIPVTTDSVEPVQTEPAIVDTSVTPATVSGSMVTTDGGSTTTVDVPGTTVTTPTVPTTTTPGVTTDTPVSYGPLTAPKVLTINGVSYTADQLAAGVTVDTVVVKVSGEITGAEKVVVNYYTLQKFVPSAGKETFVYWANGNSSNMKPGENTYTVYGISPDGTKSPVATFKLIYKPKEEPKTDSTTTSDTTVPAADTTTSDTTTSDTTTNP